MCVAVACKASLTNLSGSGSRKDEDFRLVATALDVCRSRPVARLAAVPLLAGGSLQVCVPVLCGFDLPVLLCVASLASVGSDVLWRRRSRKRRRYLGNRATRLVFCCRTHNEKANYDEDFRPPWASSYRSTSHGSSKGSVQEAREAAFEHPLRKPSTLFGN
jgi:hypothetical protein